VTPAKAIGTLAFIAVAVLGLANQDQPPPKLVQPQQPKPGNSKVVECRWLTGALKIDGVVNERSWTDAEAITLQVPWEKRAAKTATTARLLWDREYLYFSAEMDDGDLYADVQNANGPVWENDSFALFFKPHDTKLSYYEFGINAANVPFQLFLPSRGGGGYKRFAAGTEIKIESAVKLRGTLNNWTDKDKGWTVEGRIPWSVFQPSGGRPKGGDRWRFALCRSDYSVTLERPELSTSAPLTAADFHHYEEYQELVFVERQ